MKQRLPKLNDLRKLSRKLHETPVSPPAPLTEDRVRQIVNEEVSRRLSGLRLTSVPVRRGGCG